MREETGFTYRALRRRMRCQRTCNVVFEGINKGGGDEGRSETYRIWYVEMSSAISSAPASEDIVSGENLNWSVLLEPTRSRGRLYSSPAAASRASITES